MVNNQSRYSISEHIDRRFSSGGVSAVDAYINSLTFPITYDGTSNTDFPITERSGINLNDYADVYLGADGGRLAKGLRTLELLSKQCRGVDPRSLHLFNNVAPIVDAATIKGATKDQLTNIILASLGMTLVVNEAESILPDEVIKFRALCQTIGQKVRAGVFSSEDYKARVVVSAKLLVATASRKTK